eukprot:1162584-Pleurochrysis_carterae.AAC.4
MERAALTNTYLQSCLICFSGLLALEVVWRTGGMVVSALSERGRRAMILSGANTVSHKGNAESSFHAVHLGAR